METYTCHSRQNCGELEDSLDYMARQSQKRKNETKYTEAKGCGLGKGVLA